MTDTRIVLCPIDFTDLSRRELALATEVCAAFGARLVLHHNIAEIAPGLTREWEWDQYNQAGYIGGDETEARLRALLDALPDGVAGEAMVSRGPVGSVLLDMAARLPADLVVLGYHELKNLDHASVTERMLDECRSPLLVLHEDAAIDRFRLRGAPLPVVVSTGLGTASTAVTDYAFALARQAPLQLHLLHVAAGDAARDAALAQLRALVPADLAGQVTCHAQEGQTIDGIVALAARLGAGFVLMGEHARHWLRDLFVRDTARAMLGRAACPIWYVPPRGLSAARSRS
jgi:nucleotide-binding universal stress UspA family protein